MASNHKYVQTDGAPLYAWTGHGAFTLEIEDQALRQAKEAAQLPFVHKHLALMPDAHWGEGAPIGLVMATRGAVCPAAAGRDLGCGMQAKRLTLKADDIKPHLKALRLAIEKAVPHGRTSHYFQDDHGAWGTLPDSVSVTFEKNLEEGFNTILYYSPGVDPSSGQLLDRAVFQFGTLGSGNHFIEVCASTDDEVWIMLHSGSRGVGAAIGNYFTKKARELNQQWFITPPNENLAYLVEGTETYDFYLYALEWAQKYARLNRNLMMAHITEAMARVLDREILPADRETPVIDCHHNYSTMEHHFGKNVLVTRKGAVCAREGMLGIIPSAMGRPSHIVRGKGNPLSFHSCSHGTGRVMSRGEARRRFNATDVAYQTVGLESRKDIGIVDELPDCYKDGFKVMQAQTDLVDIEHIITALLCVKG